MVSETFNSSSLRVAVSRRCPQGGEVLSPLLWCLVVDDLIMRLSGSGIYIQGHADDTYVFLRWVNSQTRCQDSSSVPF